MRVLCAVNRMGRAGMEQQLLHLVEALAARGHTATLAYIRTEMDLSFLAASNVAVEPLRAEGRARRALAIARVAALARRHDVVHATGWDASWWARVGGRLGGRPVLVTEHALARETQVSSNGAPRGRWIARSNRLLDPVTYATVAVARRQVPLLRGEGVSAEKIVVIPNGVPLGPLRAAAPIDLRALGVPDGARVIVHVARFEAPKRQEATLDMVARLRERALDAHVLFAGDGSRRADVERRAAAQGADWAHFLGVRSDVPALLAAADLAVLPSSAEALPMAVVEAMAAGVPQVVTDVGDMGDVLRAGDAGLVVPAGDQAAYVAACERVLTDAELAARLRAGARAASAEYDAERMVDRYEALFGAAVAGRRRA